MKAEHGVGIVVESADVTSPFNIYDQIKVLVENVSLDPAVVKAGLLEVLNEQQIVKLPQLQEEAASPDEVYQKLIEFFNEYQLAQKEDLNYPNEQDIRAIVDAAIIAANLPTLMQLQEEAASPMEVSQVVQALITSNMLATKGDIPARFTVEEAKQGALMALTFYEAAQKSDIAALPTQDQIAMLIAFGLQAYGTAKTSDIPARFTVQEVVDGLTIYQAAQKADIPARFTVDEVKQGALIALEEYDAAKPSDIPPPLDYGMTKAAVVDGLNFFGAATQTKVQEAIDNIAHLKLLVEDTPTNAEFAAALAAAVQELKDFIEANQPEVGPFIYSGIDAPDPMLGRDGDLYLNLMTFELFKKQMGMWVSIGSLKGADGAQGPIGPQGPQGEKGEKGDTGEPGPAGADGVIGKDGKDGIAITFGSRPPYAIIGPQGPQGISGAFPFYVPPNEQAYVPPNTAVAVLLNTTIDGYVLNDGYLMELF